MTAVAADLLKLEKMSRRSSESDPSTTCACEELTAEWRLETGVALCAVFHVGGCTRLFTSAGDDDIVLALQNFFLVSEF